MKALVAAISISTFSVLGPLPDQVRDIDHRSTVTAGERIEIRGFSGSEIEFKSWDKDEVVLTIHVRIDASDQEYEEEYVSSLEIREERQDGVLLLELRELERGSREGGFWKNLFGVNYLRKEIRGEVFVPRSNPLTTDLRYGSITLSDMKGQLNILGTSNTLELSNCSNVQRVENDYGTSVLKSCGGDLALNGTSSKVTVESFKGPVVIDAKYSTIRLTGITEGASVISQSGTITAEAIGGDLKIEADYSTVSASDVDGILTVEDKSGSIRAKNTKGLVVVAPYTTVDAIDVSGKDVSVSTQSGSVTLERIKANLMLDGPYSNMDLKDIRGHVSLRSKSSRITADAVEGDWKSGTEYSTLRLRGLNSNSVEITNKSNEVTVELRKVPEKIDIRNEYGNVLVSLPGGFSGEVALDSEYGRVETNLPVRVRERGSSAYAVGKVGTGSAKISIETKSGDIELLQK